MNDAQDAMREAQASAEGAPGSITGMLAGRVGDRAGVKAIFGDPVERDGVTVIPVGRMRWGFGGGEGRGSGEGEGEGSGGGGGVSATPVGYIEIAGGSAQYRPIGFPISPGTIIAGAVAIFLTLRGLRSLLR